MNDLGTIFLAVGPAAVTGVVGYAVARLQSDTTTRQLEAETERLRLQHAETVRQHRETTYRELLSLMYRLDGLVAGFGPEPFSKEALAAWIAEFQRIHSGINLFGTDSTRSAVDEVKDAVDSIGIAARSRARATTLTDEFARAYRDQRDALIAAVETTIAAMREDVHPD